MSDGGKSNGTRRTSGAPDDGITRRDFLDGVAITAAGLAAAAASPYLTGAEAALAAVGGQRPPSSYTLPTGYYPPTSTGVTGEPDNVVRDTMEFDPPAGGPEDIHAYKRGPGFDPNFKDVDDDYDCVIVGAGASGLAAAKYYLDRFGPSSKILLLDQLPDFGGNSHRNEFHVPDAFRGGADVMTLRNGGTVEPGLDRHLEQAAGRTDGDSGLLRPAVRQHPRLGRRRLRDRLPVDERGRSGHPGLVRVALDAALPGRRFRDGHGDPEPDRAEYGGGVGDVHEQDALLAAGQGRDHPDPDVERRRDGRQGRPDDPGREDPAPDADDVQALPAVLLGLPRRRVLR